MTACRSSEHTHTHKNTKTHTHRHKITHTHTHTQLVVSLFRSYSQCRLCCSALNNRDASAVNMEQGPPERHHGNMGILQSSSYYSNGQEVGQWSCNGCNLKLIIENLSV